MIDNIYSVAEFPPKFFDICFLLDLRGLIEVNPEKSDENKGLNWYSGV